LKRHIPSAPDEGEDDDEEDYVAEADAMETRSQIKRELELKNLKALLGLP